ASYFAQSLAYRGHLERILGSRSWKWSQRLRGLTLKAMGRRASPLTIGDIDKHVAAAYPVKVPRPQPRRASARPEYPPTERTGDATATKVFVGIAAIPQRKAALEKSVRSLIDQVDRIGVYLNGWEEVPSFLLHPKIEVRRSQVDGDIGDAGKFYWVE